VSVTILATREMAVSKSDAWRPPSQVRVAAMAELAFTTRSAAIAKVFIGYS